MGKIYESIDQTLAAWIGRQRTFFVATAPLSAKGHMNCSPEGGDFFRILGDSEFAVPLYGFQRQRRVLDEWAVNEGEAGLGEYRSTRNATSADGLPGLEAEPGEA